MTEPIEIPPLALRVVDFVLKNILLIGGLMLAGGVAGWSISALQPKLFRDWAIVEVGTKFVSEPLEIPQLTEIRLLGACEKKAEALNSNAAIQTHLFRDKQQRPTGLIQVSVLGESPEKLSQILSTGLQETQAAHLTFHTFELDIAKRQEAHLLRNAQALEQAIKTLDEPLPQATLRKEQLSVQLFDTHRMLNGTRSLLSGVRLKNTQLITRAPSPSPVPQKRLVFVIAGLLIGLMLGIATGVIRMHGPTTDGQPERAMNDPLIVLIIRLTARYRWTLLAAVLLCTAGGFAMGAARPAKYHGRVFAQPVVVALEGPVQEMLGTQAKLANHLSTRLPAGVQLQVNVVKNPPPAVVDLPLLEIAVTGSDPKLLQAPLQAAVDFLKDTQDLLYISEMAALRKHSEELKSDLKRLTKLETTPELHDARTRLILELSDAGRRLSTARTHAVRVLHPPRIKPISNTSTTIALTLAGMILGLFAGYLCVFLLAGARALKSG